LLYLANISFLGEKTINCSD